MPYTTERYKKLSTVSYIIDHTENVERFTDAILEPTDDTEQKLLIAIKRNTNSIKSLVHKFMDKLQKEQF